jgi:hypothetical protein
MGPLDLDPNPEGQKLPTKIENKFQVLDVLFLGLKASPELGRKIFLTKFQLFFPSILVMKPWIRIRIHRISNTAEKKENKIKTENLSSLTSYN